MRWRLSIPDQLYALVPQRLRGHGLRTRIGRRLSPLTLRIMAVNVLALAILVGAILYLSRYQDRLIDVELAALTNEANIFASAVAEGASMQNEDDTDRLVPFLARQMVRRLDEVTNARTRLYNEDGRLLADNWIVGSEASEQVVRMPLTDPNSMDIIGWLGRASSRFLKYVTPGERHWPDYIQEDDKGPPRRTEIRMALDGMPAAQVYLTPRDHRLLFSVAVPVQRYKQVLGAMNLTRSGENVERAIATVRLDIMKLFVLSLAITVLLSLYLAQAIASPIKKLAQAAERVKSGSGQNRARRQEIPDFTKRHDEIGELSGALRSMTDSLWQRMDAIESFAADVAHELKNPLASLRSAIETFSKVKDPAQQEKLLSIIQYDTVRLDRLITDISSASRLDAELSRAQMEPVDIGQMLAALNDIYGHQDGASGRVQVEQVKGPLMVAGVETRLMQVLQNLIDNALSFTPAGGTVRIAAVRKDRIVKVTVEDDGPGIPDSKLNAIFDRFYTERPAGESFGQHSGLGLSISRQIAEAHNGRLNARNRRVGEDVQGATFILELPASQ